MKVGVTVVEKIPNGLRYPYISFQAKFLISLARSYLNDNERHYFTLLEMQPDTRKRVCSMPEGAVAIITHSRSGKTINHTTLSSEMNCSERFKNLFNMLAYYASIPTWEIYGFKVELTDCHEYSALEVTERKDGKWFVELKTLVR